MEEVIEIGEKRKDGRIVGGWNFVRKIFILIVNFYTCYYGENGKRIKSSGTSKRIALKEATFESNVGSHLKINKYKYA